MAATCNELVAHAISTLHGHRVNMLIETECGLREVRGVIECIDGFSIVSDELTEDMIINYIHVRTADKNKLLFQFSEDRVLIKKGYTFNKEINITTP